MVTLTELAPEILLEILSQLFTITPHNSRSRALDLYAQRANFFAIRSTCKFLHSISVTPESIRSYFPTTFTLIANDDNPSAWSILGINGVARFAVTTLKIENRKNSVDDIHPSAEFVFENLDKFENLESVIFTAYGPKGSFSDDPDGKSDEELVQYYGTNRQYISNVFDRLAISLHKCNKLDSFLAEDMDWARYSAAETPGFKAFLRKLKNFDIRGGWNIPPTRLYGPAAFRRYQERKPQFESNETGKKWQRSMDDIEEFVTQFREHWLPNLVNVGDFHFRPGMNDVHISFSRFLDGREDILPKLTQCVIYGVPIGTSMINFIRSHPNIKTLIFRWAPLLHLATDPQPVTWEYLYGKVQESCPTLISFDVEAMDEHGVEQWGEHPVDGNPTGEAYDTLVQYVDYNRARSGLRRFHVQNTLLIPMKDDYIIDADEDMELAKEFKIEGDNDKGRKYVLVRDGIEKHGLIRVDLEPFFPDGALEYQNENGDLGEEESGEQGEYQPFEDSDQSVASRQQDSDSGIEGDDLMEEQSMDSFINWEQWDYDEDLVQRPGLSTEGHMPPSSQIEYSHEGHILEHRECTSPKQTGHDQFLINEKRQEIRFSMKSLGLNAWLVRDIPNEELIQTFKSVKRSGGVWNCHVCKQDHELSFNMDFGHLKGV